MLLPLLLPLVAICLQLQVRRVVPALVVVVVVPAVSSATAAAAMSHHCLQLLAQQHLLLEHRMLAGSKIRSGIGAVCLTLRQQ
jgi:hypothetical protein